MVNLQQLELICKNAKIIVECSESAIKNFKEYEEMSREDIENYNDQLSSIVMATDDIQDIMLDF